MIIKGALFYNSKGYCIVIWSSGLVLCMLVSRSAVFVWNLQCATPQILNLCTESSLFLVHLASVVIRNL